MSDFGKLACSVDQSVLVEAVARAWASMNGELRLFDAGKGLDEEDQPGSHYIGYMCEAEELLERAARYLGEVSAA